MFKLDCMKRMRLESRAFFKMLVGWKDFGRKLNATSFLRNGSTGSNILTMISKKSLFSRER
jgi:hypothetical protein